MEVQGYHTVVSGLQRGDTAADGSKDAREQKGLG